MSQKAGNRWNNIGQALLSDGFSTVIPSPGVMRVCEGTGRIGAQWGLSGRTASQACDSWAMEKSNFAFLYDY